MKVRRLYELINRYSRSLDDEISFYDSNDNELKLADIDGDDGQILIVFEQKSKGTEEEVEKELHEYACSFSDWNYRKVEEE